MVKENWKRNTTDKRLGVWAAFFDSMTHSPRIAPRRKCSCPPCSMTPIAAGPFCLLPSHHQKTLSSGRRNESPLQGQQGQPQTHFQMMIRHCQLLWKKELYSDLFQTAGEAQEGPAVWGPTLRSHSTLLNCWGYRGTAPGTYRMPGEAV